MGFKTIIQTVTLGTTLLIANQNQLLGHEPKPQTEPESQIKKSHDLSVIEVKSIDLAMGILSGITGGVLAAYLAYYKGKKVGIELSKEEYNKAIDELEKTVDGNHRQCIKEITEFVNKNRRKPPSPSNN